MKLRDPLLVPALSLGAGILIAPWIDLAVWQILLALFFFIWATALSRYRLFYAVGVALLIGCLAERALRSGPEPELDTPPGETVLLAGCVVEPPVFSEGREQFVLELADNARARVNLYFREGESPPDLAYGQQIEIEARVRKPRNFQNPGSFDYRAYLARRQIYWQASSRAGTAPTVLKGRCGNRLTGALFAARRFLLTRTESLVTDPYALALHQALLIGESARLERAWADDFRRTGTYHAIVVSGLHISVIAAVIVILFRLLFLGTHTARLLAVILVWAYAGICLWQAPVVRAAAGFTFFVLGAYFYRRSRVLNLLGAVAIAYLLVDPSQALEGSFQLTFFSMLALGALAAPAADAVTSVWRHAFRELEDPLHDPFVPPRAAQFRIELRLLAETLHWLLRVPPRATYWACRIGIGWLALPLAEAMLVSAAVQLGLTLPMVYFFHRVSFTALLVNPIVTLLLTIAVPIGIVAVLTNLAPIAAVSTGLISVSRLIANFAASSEPNIRVPDPPLLLALAFAVSLAALAIFRRRWLLAPALALLGVILWHPFPARNHPGELELTMIDVGQGDSLLVGSPDGRWMVVDGGGIPVFRKGAPKPRLDIGEDVVTNYLLSRSIRRVDVVVNTHQHEDHAGGLPAVIDNFRPAELWVGATPDSEIWQSLQQAAQRNGTRIRHLHRGDQVRLGSMPIDVISPAADYPARSTPRNDDSLALRLRHGRHAFLLTGDIERNTEWAIADNAIRADVLKVAHHGSKTSTTPEFLDHVRPTFAFISAGADNIFRHPHADVVERLRDSHTRILRSDRTGLISIHTDGHRFTLEPHLQTSILQPLFAP
ncbi:MAG: ComEC/Rec2 family competence protein [Bryobacterales bacterium]|nr:ComEC/Rec2 family competence protein [Bryobacterales bacterium]